MTGRAKWDAWNLASETYEGRPSEAEHRYLDIARDLGWKEGCAPAAATSETEERATGGGGSGMGVSVSVMSSPPEDEGESATGLHAYAMRDDVVAMSAFLQAGEDGLDIDARDEYVSKKANWCKKKPGAHCFVFCRDTRHCIWPQIEGTSPRSSFYSSTAPTKHSE
jgi:hypothetical protein